MHHEGDPPEDELTKRAEELEEAIMGGVPPDKVKDKAKRLAQQILHHLEDQRESPIEQRRTLVRLAQKKVVFKILQESGLIEIDLDPNLGRVVIKLAADNDLSDLMDRANSADVLHAPNAPFIRVFRQDLGPDKK